MMYYCFEIDEESKQLATIVNPYGKFQYCRMSMGLKPSPDFAQSLNKQLLADLDVDVYIDDINFFWMIMMNTWIKFNAC
jgi:glycyl-tRNA synthetase alpha subunit